MNTLTDSVKAILNKTDHFHAVYVKLHSQEKPLIQLNQDSIFHAASTMKTAVMYEVFRQAGTGKFSLTDSLLVKNEFKSIIDGSPYSLDLSDDSDDLLYSKINSMVSITELVEQMITVSSNLATNILIELVGAENVQNSMNQLGAGDVKVLRGVEDGKAFREGKNNTVTAYSLAQLFQAILNGNPDSNSAKKMIEVLSRQKHNTQIPALLPADAIVAHKTGSITGIIHDSGIVFMPDKKAFIIILLSKNVRDTKKTRESHARVSQVIYNFIATEY